MSDLAIQVVDLSKRYLLGAGGGRSFKRTISQSFGRLTGKTAERKELWALKDVSFEVRQGEIFGILGPNGSGKSTLLKILSRVVRATSGHALVRGQVSSLLEIGAGFHPDLTGRENVFLNGSMLGMSRPEILAKFDEIVDFSGIEPFIDTPVKRYSSGMYVRLAFSVAAHLRTDIVLIDEILSVGDVEFKRKSLDKILDIVNSAGTTVLFVSHNLGAIRESCDRALYLDHGRVTMNAGVDKVITHYRNESLIMAPDEAEEEESVMTESVKSWPDSKAAPGTGRLRVLDMRVHGIGKAPGETITMDDEIEVNVRFRKTSDAGALDATIQFTDGTGVVFMVSSSAFTDDPPRDMPAGLYHARCVVPTGLFNSGLFKIDLLFHQDKKKQAIFRYGNMLSFTILPREFEFGIPFRQVTGPIRPLLDWEVRQVNGAAE